MLSRPQGHSAAERIMSMKNSNDTIGNRSRDLPVCSAVPQTLWPACPKYITTVILIIVRQDSESLWAGRSGYRIPWGGGVIFFSTRPDRPWDPTSLLYNRYGIFPGGKTAGARRWPPTLSTAEVKERVELYFYSHSVFSWPILVCTLALPLHVILITFSLTQLASNFKVTDTHRYIISTKNITLLPKQLINFSVRFETQKPSNMIKILCSLCHCNIRLCVYKYPLLLCIRHGSCLCITCRVFWVGGRQRSPTQTTQLCLKQDIHFCLAFLFNKTACTTQNTRIINALFNFSPRTVSRCVRWCT
jgi:hypothetical protein